MAAAAAAVIRPALRFVRLRGYPILQQLRVEERLYKKSQENWCIFNEGTPHPNIVMGASGVANELLDLDAVLSDRIPVVRRKSGGGTVVVDDQTIFVTLILSKQPFLRLNTSGLTAWCSDLYKEVFRSVDPRFQLRESDHAFGDRKFGGSAQMMRIHTRGLVHTSFLWDYEEKRMSYLTNPRRAPAYRLGRSHLDFICRLKDYLPHKEQFYELLQTGLKHYFSLQPSTIDDIEAQVEECETTASFLPIEELRRLRDDELSSLREAAAS